MLIPEIRSYMLSLISILTNHFTQITYFLKSLPSKLFLKICFSKLFGLLFTFVHLFTMVTPTFTFKIVNISNDMTSDIIIMQHSLKQHEKFQHIHQIEMQGCNLKQWLENGITYLQVQSRAPFLNKIISRIPKHSVMMIMQHSHTLGARLGALLCHIHVVTTRLWKSLKSIGYIR